MLFPYKRACQLPCYDPPVWRIPIAVSRLVDKSTTAALAGVWFSRRPERWTSLEAKDEVEVRDHTPSRTHETATAYIPNHCSWEKKNILISYFLWLLIARVFFWAFIKENRWVRRLFKELDISLLCVEGWVSLFLTMHFGWCACSQKILTYYYQCKWKIDFYQEGINYGSSSWKACTAHHKPANKDEDHGG